MWCQPPPQTTVGLAAAARGRCAGGRGGEGCWEPPDSPGKKACGCRHSLLLRVALQSGKEWVCKAPSPFPGPPGPQPSLLPCLNSLLSISHHGYLASKGGLLLPGLQYGAQALCWQPNPVSGAAGGGGFATDVALLQRRPGMGASGYADGWE